MPQILLHYGSLSERITPSFRNASAQVNSVRVPHPRRSACLPELHALWWSLMWPFPSNVPCLQRKIAPATGHSMHSMHSMRSMLSFKKRSYMCRKWPDITTGASSHRFDEEHHWHLFCSTASKYFCFFGLLLATNRQFFCILLGCVRRWGQNPVGLNHVRHWNCMLQNFAVSHVYHVSTMSGEIHIRITRTMFCWQFWSNPRSMRQTAAACWHRPSKHSRRKKNSPCAILNLANEGDDVERSVVVTFQICWTKGCNSLSSAALVTVSQCQSDSCLTGVALAAAVKVVFDPLACDPNPGLDRMPIHAATWYANLLGSKVEMPNSLNARIWKEQSNPACNDLAADRTWCIHAACSG